MYDKNWYKVDAMSLPVMVANSPGPKSKEMHGRASKIMKGYSGQVRLHPVVFESGHGCTLKDVDGNTYIDFSSGIVVASLGHCHPKITEAVTKAANNLMNAHDFTSPIKMKLLEKLAEMSMGDLNGIQLYDSGTTAVEAGLRAARAATGKDEFVAFFRDFHGKTRDSVSCAAMSRANGVRSPGFVMAPRPNCYHCPFKLKHPECNLHCADFIEMTIDNSTTGNVAAIVIEPVQGWGGAVLPPEGFFPKVRKICDERGILLFADEVLMGTGRSGKMWCMEHYDTQPDIMTIGKGFGNGFPVTAMMIREEYKEALEKISASTSYGGNPMACAAALACLEVIEEENLCDKSAATGKAMLKRLEEIKERHSIVGDVRGCGMYLGMELVKDRETKEAFTEAGIMVYQKAFSKGVAWVPQNHILRLSPPIIMDEDLAMRGLDIIEEAIEETEKHFGY